MVLKLHQGEHMSTLVLKGVPESLRKELKDRAAEHRRSVTQEAIGILELALKRVHIVPPAKPIKVGAPLRMNQVIKMIRKGRA